MPTLFVDRKTSVRKSLPRIYSQSQWQSKWKMMKSILPVWDFWLHKQPNYRWLNPLKTAHGLFLIRPASVRKIRNFNIYILVYRLIILFHSGYYRVNYDAENWNLVSNLLKENFTELSSLTRSQIIDDVFNLARCGYVHYSLLFELLTTWKTEETNYFPWKIVLDNLEFIYRNSVDLPSFRSVKVSLPIFHCNLKAGFI